MLGLVLLAVLVTAIFVREAKKFFTMVVVEVLILAVLGGLIFAYMNVTARVTALERYLNGGINVGWFPTGNQVLTALQQKAAQANATSTKK